MAAVGAALVAIGVCCGVPVLLSAGVLTAVVGFGLGSGIVLATSAAVVAAALVRVRSRTHDVATLRSTDAQRFERSPSHVE